MRKTIGSLALLVLANCAQVTATPVTSDNPSPAGIPIYGHKPILLVGTDGLKIETIPNLSERYAVQLNAFFAKNETDLTISDRGLLHKVEANLDSAAALQPLLDFAKDVLAAQQPVPSLQSREANFTEFFAVYEFVFRDDGSLELKELLSKPLIKSDLEEEADNRGDRSTEEEADKEEEGERGTLRPRT